ncbi:LppM family (lipo)protein [Rhodococcus sp. As11]|uniref:LppM family (lipo)protein n=1 Tax=Rhodococcus sp. As11 TaxID=3029189 RepID=UPI003B81EC7B
MTVPGTMFSVQSSTMSVRRRVVAVVGLVLLAVPLLTGCLRVQATMGISSDDRVSGQIVAATIPADENDPGPELTAPSALAGKVRVQEYSQDGYVGSQVFFNDLTFGDVQQLATMSDQSAGMFQLNLQRSGDLVALNGRVDLESAPSQGTDVQFTIAFPARVATTNGTRESDSIVTWKLPAGEVSSLRAEVRYADPNTRGFAGWAGIMAGAVFGVTLIIAGTAWFTRNPAPRWSATSGTRP